MLTDERLRHGADLALNALLGVVPADYVCAPSPAFVQDMDRLRGQVRRRMVLQRAGRTAAVLLLAVLLGFSALLAFNQDVRAAFSRWTRGFTDGWFTYTHIEESASHSLTAWIYAPAWLPDGYVETTTSRGGAYRVFTNEAGDWIAFQVIRSSESATVAIGGDGYNVKTEDVTVRRMDGQFYLDLDGGTNDLVLEDPADGVLFLLSAALPKETLLRIAESIVAIP